MTERMEWKMSDRPWTCVYTAGNKTLLVKEMGEFDSHVARQTLRDKHPGYELRALIPGDHVMGSMVAEPSHINPGAARRAAVQAPCVIDPFDTPYGSDK